VPLVVILATLALHGGLTGHLLPSTLSAKMTSRALPLAWQTGGIGAAVGVLIPSLMKDLSDLAVFLLGENPVVLLLLVLAPALFLAARRPTPPLPVPSTDGPEGNPQPPQEIEPGGGIGPLLPVLWLAWASLPVTAILVGWVGGPEYYPLNHGRYFPMTALLASLAVLLVTGRLWEVRRRPGWLALPVCLALLFGLDRHLDLAWRYGQEVDTINRLQVRSALWAAKNLAGLAPNPWPAVPPAAHPAPDSRSSADPCAVPLPPSHTNMNVCLMAVNDVGAMAYFGGHRLLDLEGLMTPAVIPHKHRGALLPFLEQARPAFLLVFPYWYPELMARQDLFRPLMKFVVARNLTGGGEELVLFSTPWRRDSGQ